MTRRNLLRKGSLVLPTIMAASCATVADLALRSQYLIRPEQILSQLLPYFPFSRQAAGIGQVNLANPVFSMAPDINKVRVGLTTGLAAAQGLGERTGIPALEQIAGRATSGTCQLACGLRYDSQSRGIFLREPVVEILDFEHLPPSLTNPIRQVVNLFGPQFLDRHPIHTLDPSLATRFLNSMEVQSGGIALKFSPLG
jgi:hypothetical protein